ncbi:MAG: sigma-70 family RNA polymerase sigma factor [Phycisphaerales bacterium]|nr:MAG: sigma-70 family RNA polymerase sigma factor [Phycisphaerales bacterium]
MTRSQIRQVHPLKAATDEDLAYQAASGSVTAFAELLERYEGRVYNFVLRRIPCSADAEDITQETSVRAWQRIGQYNRRWRFSTWLFTIASRLTTNHLRTAARRQRTEAAARAAGEDETNDDDPSSMVDRDETCRHIWAVAAEILTREQHAALWLRYAEDLPLKEIARILGRTAVGCRVTLFRARQRLAEHYEATERRPAEPAGSFELRPIHRQFVNRQMTGGV